MTKFIKKAQEILENEKWEKNIKNYIKNLKDNTEKKYLLETYQYHKKYPTSIIYENFDFFRCKLKDNNKKLEQINNNLQNIYTNLNIYQMIDFHLWTSNIPLFDNQFFIIYAWLTFWNQKKLYDIYDIDKNKVWQIIIKNPKHRNIAKNVINSLELSWLFFKSYSEYFYPFLQYFNIDIQEQNIIKRLDYCIDLKWVEIPELLNFIKPVFKKSKSVVWLTHSDKKKLNTLFTDLKYWKTETFINYFNCLNDLKIYDKILDLVDNYMKRKVNWKNPYQDYINSDLPITRIELKKKWEAFANIQDNSIEYILNNIQAMFYDYLKKYFYIDLSLYEWENISLNWKKNYLAKQEKQKKILHSYQMAQAYLNNIKEYDWENNLYKFLFTLYPEIEKIKSLDFLTDVDISDYFSWISETL